MIKFIKIIIPLTTCIFLNSAFATNYTAVGKIKSFYAIDHQLWGSDIDYVQIEGFVNAGTCKTDVYGVLIRMRGDQGGNRQYATALSAKLAGKNIRVAVDDTEEKDPFGYCFLRNISIVD